MVSIMVSIDEKHYGAITTLKRRVCCDGERCRNKCLCVAGKHPGDIPASLVKNISKKQD